MIITRCPACLTAFRVSPEQLARRNGRVRCGHCYRPFDAQAHRIADDALDDPTLPPVIQSRRKRSHAIPQAPEPPAPPAAPPSPAVDTPTEPEPPRPTALPDLDFELPSLPDDTAPEPTPEPESIAPPAPEPAQPVVATVEPAASPDTPPAPRRWQPLGESAAVLREARYRRPGAATRQADDTATPEAPSVEQHWRQNAYAPPGAPVRHRWLWALCIGTLLGVLAAQASYIWREPITRDFPQLRPLYLQACQRLGCEVPLPRVARLLAIEHSNMDFNTEHSAYYELQAVLRNRAPHPQQLPHIELTLTDLDDQPLARRALAPSEWLPEGRDIADGIATDERIRLTLPFAVRDLKGVTGFRVVAFYP